MNHDLTELLATFAARDVRYLVVGGYAVTFHSKPRFTKDLDVWVDPTPANAVKVEQALAEFGAPLTAHGVTAKDFERPGVVYQMGLPPNRVDVLTAVDGLSFGPCWDRRVVSSLGNTPVAYLSKADLIVNKRTVGRPQDLEDARALERKR